MTATTRNNAGSNDSCERLLDSSVPDCQSTGGRDRPGRAGRENVGRQSHWENFQILGKFLGGIPRPIRLHPLAGVIRVILGQNHAVFTSAFSRRLRTSRFVGWIDEVRISNAARISGRWDKLAEASSH